MSEMIQKHYVNAQGLLEDSFRLGAKIVASRFDPTFMIAIWRGGTPVGIVVQELFAYCGIKTDHISIRTSHYSGIEEKKKAVAVHGMDYLIKNINHDDRLLIVDDVFDTGKTIEAVIDNIRRQARRNAPDDIRVAVAHYKPSRNQTDRMPDYYVHETEQWLKYPHSLEGLSLREIKTNRPRLYAIMEPHLHLLEDR